MNQNSEILAKLIEEDFGLDTKEGSRWGKSDEHSSLVLDKERGIFFWNAKNVVGDPLTYLTKVRGMDFQKARDVLREYRNFSSSFVYTIKNDEDDVIVYPKLVEVFFDDGRDKREYFYSRGLTDSTIDRFQLGYYNGFNTIPYFVDGTFRNFQLRKDNPRTFKNYYKGVGPLLFNSDILKITNKIYLTEGPIDAMVLIQNGLPAVSATTILPQWFSNFVRQSTIYVLYDNDSAGENEAKRSSKILGLDRCKVYCFWDFDEKGYDPVDFFRDGNTADELIKLVENNYKYGFEV